MVSTGWRVTESNWLVFGESLIVKIGDGREIPHLLVKSFIFPIVNNLESLLN